MAINTSIRIFAGSKSSSHDGSERSRGGLFVCRPRLAADRPAQSGHAAEGVQLPLPRTEARRHRRLGRLHPARVEDAAESAQNIRSQRNQTNINIERREIERESHNIIADCVFN